MNNYDKLSTNPIPDTTYINDDRAARVFAHGGEEKLVEHLQAEYNMRNCELNTAPSVQFLDESIVGADRPFVITRRDDHDAIPLGPASSRQVAVRQDARVANMDQSLGGWRPIITELPYDTQNASSTQLAHNGHIPLHAPANGSTASNVTRPGRANVTILLNDDHSTDPTDMHHDTVAVPENVHYFVRNPNVRKRGKRAPAGNPDTTSALNTTTVLARNKNVVALPTVDPLDALLNTHAASGAKLQLAMDEYARITAERRMSHVGGLVTLETDKTPTNRKEGVGQFIGKIATPLAYPFGTLRGKRIIKAAQASRDVYSKAVDDFIGDISPNATPDEIQQIRHGLMRRFEQRVEEAWIEEVRSDKRALIRSTTPQYDKNKIRESEAWIDSTRSEKIVRNVGLGVITGLGTAAVVGTVIATGGAAAPVITAGSFVSTLGSKAVSRRRVENYHRLRIAHDESRSDMSRQADIDLANRNNGRGPVISDTKSMVAELESRTRRYELENRSRITRSAALAAGAAGVAYGGVTLVDGALHGATVGHSALPNIHSRPGNADVDPTNYARGTHSHMLPTSAPEIANQAHNGSTLPWDVLHLRHPDNTLGFLRDSVLPNINKKYGTTYMLKHFHEGNIDNWRVVHNVGGRMVELDAQEQLRLAKLIDPNFN